MVLPTPTTRDPGVELATQILTLIACFVSASASAVMIAIMVYLRKLLDARTLLVLCLGVADFIQSASPFISTLSYVTNKKLERGLVCTVTGFALQYGTQASDLATFSLALITFLELWMRDRGGATPAERKELIKLMLFMILTVPFVTAMLGQVLIGYGPAGSHCWIVGTPQPAASIVRYSINQIWRIVIFCAIVPLYAWVFITLRRERRVRSRGEAINAKSLTHEGQLVSQRDRELKNIRVLSLFPIIYVILWFPNLVARSYECVTGKPSPDLLYVLNGCFFWIGLCDACIYVFGSVEIRSRVREAHNLQMKRLKTRGSSTMGARGWESGTGLSLGLRAH